MDIYFLAGHFMIVDRDPRIFDNGSRSLKTSQNTWVEPNSIGFFNKYGAEWRDGAIACSTDGECYHLKFGGSGWTYVGGPFVGGFRSGGYAVVMDEVYWVLGGKGTLGYLN